MVDDNTLFSITKDTYQHKGVKNWSRLHEFDDAADRLSGLNSTVSKNGNNIVIAFSGTNPMDIRDLASNYNVWAQQKKSHQSKDAEALFKSVAKKYPKANIQFTGYSDGASKAIELSYKTGLRATTFAAAGGKQIYEKNPAIYKYGGRNIRSYGMANDPFFMNNLKNQAGEVFILPSMKQNGPVGSHFLHKWPSLNTAQPFNPQTQWINPLENNKIEKIPTNWQKYLNQPQSFSKLQPSKLDELKNPPVQGVSGSVGDASVTGMDIIQPQPVVLGQNTTNWLGQLGSILSGASSLVQLGVGAAGGISSLNAPSATTSVSGKIITPGVQLHTGGKVKPQSGRDEVLAILRGNETVRTEAQEQELQQEKYAQLMEAVRPYLEEKEKPKTIAEAYDPENKIPCLLNKTAQDEEMIIAIIGQAWKSNRLGFRNVLRYE